MFAHYLRTNPRTLENWEHGREKPNTQAALLVRLVKYFPDTVDLLAEVRRFLSLNDCQPMDSGNQLSLAPLIGASESGHIGYP